VTSISTLRNLGPATERIFLNAGIETAEQLIELGADEAYRRVLANGTRPHFIGYYALVMGLQGRPWNDCTGQETKTLRARFDALKTAVSPASNERAKMEAALDALGVIKRN